MSGFDVEALLEETANEFRLDRPQQNGTADDEEPKAARNVKSRDLLDSPRGRRNDNDSRSERDNGTRRNTSSQASDHGHRRRRNREDDEDRYYRPSGGRRSGRGRSRSPNNDDRHYRPDGRRDNDRRRSRDRDDDRVRDRSRDRNRDRRDRDRDGDRGRLSDDRRRDSDRNGDHRRAAEKPKSPPINEDERDRRTVFVQQLAARLRTRDLHQFFEQVGPVREAQIVKDRVSGRSKGVGYVEFLDEESVPKAIELTGQKLLGIPIIAQLTEAEKNRQARNPDSSSNNAGAPFHRLYVGNIHFSVTDKDLSEVFSPFGALEFVQLHKDDQGRSRGYGFVQFQDADCAKTALEAMNGFELANRPIRVGLGNDKFGGQDAANNPQRTEQAANGSGQPSTLFGAGGRGQHAGGSGNFGGAGRDNGAGGASALDDTDVNGVNFRNVSREALMMKLARAEDNMQMPSHAVQPAQTFIASQQVSRCIKITNVFDMASELKEFGSGWAANLEKEMRQEAESSYGPVLHCAVNADDDNGEVYIKFADAESGKKAIQGLNGRLFAGRMLTASPVVDAIYNSRFPTA